MLSKKEKRIWGKINNRRDTKEEQYNYSLMKNINMIFGLGK